jgi:hypothetical protein
MCLVCAVLPCVELRVGEVKSCEPAIRLLPPGHFVHVGERAYADND